MGPAGAPSRRGVGEEVRFMVSRTLLWLPHYTVVLAASHGSIYTRGRSNDPHIYGRLKRALLL